MESRRYKNFFPFQTSYLWSLNFRDGETGEREPPWLLSPNFLQCKVFSLHNLGTWTLYLTYQIMITLPKSSRDTECTFLDIIFNQCSNLWKRPSLCAEAFPPRYKNHCYGLVTLWSSDYPDVSIFWQNSSVILRFRLY